MIKVLEEFYDLETGDLRQAGTEFEATKERFDELNEALPGYVEWSEPKEDGKSKVKGKKDEVAAKDELPI
ncbi:hypothetical protein FXF62_10265 [Streptococcus cristatus]|jgi:hypothetical protein|uniref:Uncharacterized protein n=1 Tax=Streptococcus cristatus TaxID=45634 RepID=A0A5B0D9J3_STRCR|nr:hypothetical protein [Streptococcus cristatus]KAA0963208.1 hypothetical protein FXF62_10265 [Streptococcus cristatus]